jgi:hypothetical protein
MCEKFLRHSLEKIKAGVFIGLQICQLFRDPQFDLAPSDDKKATRNAFRHVATGFLGNVKAVTVNFGTFMEDLFLQEAHCTMSLQDAFPPLTLGLLSSKCQAVSV